MDRDGFGDVRRAGVAPGPQLRDCVTEPPARSSPRHITVAGAAVLGDAQIHRAERQSSTAARRVATASQARAQSTAATAR